ncbi:type II toxin-antitoxin system HicA family toxin [Varibaculum cambriense]|uniref:type II toxin-antitoxin system HicA family toxin n=2 Tax=Varibaculum cambriense TaxID=184870 RepID=UPI002911CAA6|nr:type II toxin-antitoxin system HicA family toxin [Varibaculum cambriense]MDU7408678.1 type II toxin-antitoxin system HicA family toxin [Varibaculum cambriense]
MVKPMKYRDMVKLLRAAGFEPRPGKGDHEVWRKGQISTVIVKTRQLSPGVTRTALKAIERSKNETFR